MSIKVAFRNWEKGPTSLFVVYNTAHKSLYVLAKDQEEARSIAWSACHIRYTDNGLNGEGRGVHLLGFGLSFELAPHWDVIQKTAAKGGRGTVTLENDVVFIGHTAVS